MGIFNWGKKAQPAVVVDLEDEIAALKAQLESLEGRRSVEDQLAEMEEKITALKAEATALELTGKHSKAEITKLENQVAKLESQKTIADDELKTLLKVDEERQKLENERFQMKCTKEKDEAIAEVKDTYREKLEGYLKENLDKGDARFEQILQRLPDARMTFKQTHQTSGDQG